MLIIVSGSLKKVVPWGQQFPERVHDLSSIYTELYGAFNINFIGGAFHTLTTEQLQIFIEIINNKIKDSNEVTEYYDLGVTKDHLQAMLIIFETLVSDGSICGLPLNLDEFVKNIIEFKKLTKNTFRPETVEYVGLGDYKFEDYDSPLQRLTLRFIYETIHNASKYVSTAKLKFIFVNEKFSRVLSYEDNWSSLNYKKGPITISGGGLGLAGLHSEAKKLGGSCKYKSKIYSDGSRDSE